LGDSYTFGDEVSDDETWPAILERLTHHRVVNGEVSGYGTAQARLRGTQLLSAGNYSMVILSILIGSDGGDLISTRAPCLLCPHVSRPVVIRDGDVIRQTTAEEQQRAISICTNTWAGPLLWSHIANRLLVDRCRVNDPRAATVDEIIEYVTARLAALPMNKSDRAAAWLITSMTRFCIGQNRFSRRPSGTVCRR
jgi:hypothetical protein